MESADIHEVVELPLACTLGPDDGAARIQRWKALSAKGPSRLDVAAMSSRSATRPSPGIREELQALAAAERRCCSFADWQVTDEEDQLVLRISADPARPDEIAMFAVLFGAD